MKKTFDLIMPGLLVAATGVGAGDLITGAIAGNKLGLLIWLPIIGAFFKYILTDGIARYQFATGKPLVHGWVKELGKPFRYLFYFYLFIWSYCVGGALLNGATNSLALMTGMPKLFLSFSLCALAYFLVWTARFELFEKVMMVLIGLMFFAVIATSATLIQSPGELFQFKSVSFTSPWFLGLLGGVGGTLTIVCYGYWIQEEGRKGNEGYQKSKIDLAVSYSLTGLFSISMMIIGSKLPEVSKEGTKFITQISDLFLRELGTWAAWLFKIGFFCGIFSSLLGVWQSVPYLYADIRLLDKKEEEIDLKRSQPYRQFLTFISIASLSTIGMKFQFIQLIYAVVGALFIPLCALSLLMLLKRTEDPAFRNSRFQALMMMAIFLFFVAYGVHALVTKIT